MRSYYVAICFDDNFYNCRFLLKAVPQSLKGHFLASPYHIKLRLIRVFCHVQSFANIDFGGIRIGVMGMLNVLPLDFHDFISHGAFKSEKPC